MRKTLGFLCIVLLLSSFSFAQPLDKEQQKAVSELIKHVKNRNWKELANKTSFPLARDYPIPGIKDKQEFLKRYGEIFDDSLINMIVRSNLTEDWTVMGWRGIMFLNGQIWLQDDGMLRAIGYQSPVEHQMKQELIQKEKLMLHQSVRNFKEPVHVLETKKYRIRIDDIGDGDFRYAVWPLKTSMSDKPDLIIEHGTVNFDGTGGNHTYEFSNDGYIYSIDIIVMGEEDSPPALLTITKGEKVILAQDANILIK